jgi:hypothetical protein
MNGGNECMEGVPHRVSLRMRAGAVVGLGKAKAALLDCGQTTSKHSGRRPAPWP